MTGMIEEITDLTGLIKFGLIPPEKSIARMTEIKNWFSVQDEVNLFLMQTQMSVLNQFAGALFDLARASLQLEPQVIAGHCL